MKPRDSKAVVADEKTPESPPASAAAAPAPAVNAALSPAISTGSPSGYFYRGDSRSPNEVFPIGFGDPDAKEDPKLKPHKDEASLFNAYAPYISATNDMSVAAFFPTTQSEAITYIYIIKGNKENIGHYDLYGKGLTEFPFVADEETLINNFGQFWAKEQNALYIHPNNIVAAIEVERMKSAADAHVPDQFQVKDFHVNPVSKHKLEDRELRFFNGLKNKVFKIPLPMQMAKNDDVTCSAKLTHPCN